MADATTKAALIAGDTLHVSQRAYIVPGSPVFDQTRKMMLIPFLNVGHIPSGPVQIVVHEETLDPGESVPTSGVKRGRRIELHWSRHTYQSISTVTNQQINVTAFKTSLERLNVGLQTVLVTGFVLANDGFPDTPKQRHDFCFQTFFQFVTKDLDISDCDASTYLPRMEAADGYPNSKQNAGVD